MVLKLSWNALSLREAMPPGRLGFAAAELPLPAVFIEGERASTNGSRHLNGSVCYWRK